MSHPVNNLPSKSQEQRDLDDLQKNWRTGESPELWKVESKFDPEEWMKFKIRVSYDGCMTVDLNAATIEGIGSQLVAVLRHARDIGYKQAQEEIKRSLGIERI
jgi:L,D-peptidoglycan transpeptidase YkuD (ErfK/YbiS/YcfS/YnhG family)